MWRSVHILVVGHESNGFKQLNVIKQNLNQALISKFTFVCKKAENYVNL